MTRESSLVCPNCRTALPDRERRCPYCGTDLTAGRRTDPADEESADASLDEPAFLSDALDRTDTAPLAEFIAAGLVVAGFGVIVLGMALASAAVIFLGFALALLPMGFYAFSKGTFARWRLALPWPLRRRR